MAIELKKKDLKILEKLNAKLETLKNEYSGDFDSLFKSFREIEESFEENNLPFKMTFDDFFDSFDNGYEDESSYEESSSYEE